MYRHTWKYGKTLQCCSVEINTALCAMQILRSTNRYYKMFWGLLIGLCFSTCIGKRPGFSGSKQLNSSSSITRVTFTCIVLCHQIMWYFEVNARALSTTQSHLWRDTYNLALTQWNLSNQDTSNSYEYLNEYDTFCNHKGKYNSNQNTSLITTNSLKDAWDSV